MKIVILTEELQQALKLAKPFTSKKRDRMRITNRSAVVIDETLVSGIQREFTFLYESSEEVIVSVSQLKKALAGHKATTVTLQPFNNHVVVNDRIRIEEYSHNSAVWFPESKPYEEHIELTASNLQTAIKKVVKFASDNETAPVLTCIEFTLNENSLSLVATDRHRLARYAYNLDREHHLTFQQFNLPARYAELLTMIKPARSVINLHINYHSHYSEFRIDDRIRIRIKHDESTYPDVAKIIENSRGDGQWMQFDRADMLATMKDLKRVTSEKTKIAVIRYNNELCATIANGATSPTFQTTIDLTTYNDYPVKLAFNAEFMIDALDSLSYTTAFAYYKSHSQPIHILDESDDYKHNILILPFRLKELVEED